MFRRLLGLLLIVRGLSPILLVVILLVVGNMVVSDVRAAIEQPLHEIEASFQEVQTVIQNARTTFQRVGQNISGAVNWIRNNLTLTRLPPVWGFNWAVNAINAIIDGINGAFREVREVFSGIGDLLGPLRVIPEELNDILVQLKAMLDGLQNTANRWSEVMTIASLAVLVLTLIYFVVPLVVDFTRGWRMLLGRPD